MFRVRVSDWMCTRFRWLQMAPAPRGAAFSCPLDIPGHLSPLGVDDWRACSRPRGAPCVVM
jgi:hypothetical protein